MKTATRFLGHFLGLIAVVSFLVMTGMQVPSVAGAQRWPSNWGQDAGERSIREFDQFLSNHPWIAHKLWQKPSRAGSKDFQKDNPELKYWLENHPWARNQIRIDARGFMERVSDFERSGGRYAGYGAYGPWRSEATQAQMAQFGQFLDDNPGLARQLAHNPSLVNDPGCVRRHKELREFLESHPAVRDQLSENPSSFFAWYGSYDWYGRH